MDYFHYIFQAALIVIASIANAMRTQSPCYEERQCTKPFSGSLKIKPCQKRDLPKGKAWQSSFATGKTQRQMRCNGIIQNN